MIITMSQVHVDRGNFITEASMIGLAPGQWPTEITIEGVGKFEGGHPVYSGGRFYGYEYRAPGTRNLNHGKLTVFND